MAESFGPYRAPIAKMFEPLQINTGVTTSLAAHAPPKYTPEHDYYSERFALSPEDRQLMYVGESYSDRMALSPVNSEDEADNHKSLSVSKYERKKQDLQIPRPDAHTAVAGSIAATPTHVSMILNPVPVLGQQAKEPSRKTPSITANTGAKITRPQVQAKEDTKENKRPTRKVIKATVGEVEKPRRSGRQTKTKNLETEPSSKLQSPTQGFNLEEDLGKIEVPRGRKRKHQPEVEIEPRRLRRNTRAINYAE